MRAAMVRDRKVVWNSPFLKDSVPTPERAVEILRSMLDDKSPMARDFPQLDPDWLETYYLSYELFLFGESYGTTLEKIHASVPADAHVLDLGSGPGLVSAYLLKKSPSRRATLLDNGHAARLARDRLTEVVSPRRFEFISFFVGPYSQWPATGANAAVVNHTLYLMKPRTRRLALEGLFKSLPPGATLVVNEPVAERALPMTNYYRWLEDRVHEAFVGGAPHTEFHVAFLGAMCAGRVTGRVGPLPQIPFPSSRELITDLETTGFVMKDVSSTYDGFSQLLVAGRP